VGQSNRARTRLATTLGQRHDGDGSTPQQQIDPVLDRYRDRFPAGIACLSRNLAAGYTQVLDVLTKRPATIIHGDLHLDNLIFTDDAGPILLDWQGIATGPAIVDLGLFLVGSLSVEDRRDTEMGLLARYHRRLRASGVEEYTFDDLVADYYRSLVWQLAGITGWLARVDLASLVGRERALVDALFAPGQLFAACADHADRLKSLAGRRG
jgi:thiamine kinase-like enzyme